MAGKNKILIGCLALLLVLSVGYALFSETVQINGTAKAQGDFDIGFVCTDTSTGGQCGISGQTITTTSNLTKPSDVVNFTITLTNNGTIDAYLKTIDSPNNIKASGYTPTVSGDEAYYDSSKALAATYSVETKDGQILVGDAAIEAKEIVLKPNESITVVVSHSWIDLGAAQPELSSSGAEISYNLTFGFEQLTAN